MPFTAAHPLAVVPLTWWKRLDPTCLVIGAMAPDFEYFARMKQASSISHTWLGLVTWNLPVAIVLAIAWHRIVKWPLVLVLPRGLARRAGALASRPWAQPWTIGFALTAAASAVLGALSHILWDGVTHSDGFVVQQMRELRAVVDVPVLGHMVLHRVFQHTSTVIGLLVLAVLVTRALRRATPIELPDVPRAWSRVIAALCISGCTGLAIARLVLFRWWWLDDLGTVVVVVISGLLIGALVAGAVLWGPASRLRTEDLPTR